MQRLHKSLLILIFVGFLPATVWAEGYRTSIGSGGDEISVVVVKGSPFEMGRSMGVLLKNEVRDCMGGFLAAVRNQDAKMFADDKLDAAWEAIAPHTDPRFIEELRGLAEGAGIPLYILRRTHMIPVVSPWACSCLAVWGGMSQTGGLYQIRNLDFITGAGLQDYPVIVVYLPDKGIAHACTTFAGYIGANSGMNAKGICLSEKGNSPADGYPYDLNGSHFSSLFRRLLYDARSLEDVEDILRETRWFKSYYFIIGSAEGRDAIKVKVDAPRYYTWSANSPTDESHPSVTEGAVYVTMEDAEAFTYLNRHCGEHDTQTLIRLSKKLGTDNGNLLNVVYDGDALEMWVAYAEGDEGAKTRDYVQFKLRDYLEYDSEAPGVTDIVKWARVKGE